MGWSLRYLPGQGTPVFSIVAPLWERSQRGNNAAGILSSCPIFQRTHLWGWEFLSFLHPPQYLQLEVLSLIFPVSQPHLAHRVHCLGEGTLHLPGCRSPPCLSVWMNVSLTPWLSEFHAVWYSGSSGCLFFKNWLLSFFCLCEEGKYFYLGLHLGQPTDTYFKDFIYLFSERGREREREGEEQCVLAFQAPPTGDLACSPGTHLVWESNQRPFCSQASTQSWATPARTYIWYLKGESIISM